MEEGGVLSSSATGYSYEDRMQSRLEVLSASIIVVHDTWTFVGFINVDICTLHVHSSLPLSLPYLIPCSGRG